MIKSERFECNPLITYFHQKSNHLSELAKEIIEDLQMIRFRTAGVINQIPESGEFDVLAGLFSIISELVMTIEWKSLDKSYYWEDFCFEAKEIISITSKLQMFIKNIRDKSKKILTIVERLFSYIDPYTSDASLNVISDDPNLTEVQIRHSPPVGINLLWKKSQDIIATAKNPDETIAEASMECSTLGIRLRLLRYLLNYTRTAMESCHVTLKKIDVILNSEFTMYTLEKTKVKQKRLTPFEYTLVKDGKTKLHKNIIEVYTLSSLLKYHYHELKPFVAVLKKLKSKPHMIVDHGKMFVQLEICVDDDLLVKYWLQMTKDTGLNLNDNLENEDPIPIMLADRADDTLEIIGNMMRISSGCFKTIEQIIFLLRKCDWNIFDESVQLNKDFSKIKNKLNSVNLKFQSMKYFLIKSIKCINDDPILKLSVPDESQMTDFILDREMNPANLWQTKTYQGETTLVWIQLSEGFEVTYDDDRVQIKNKKGNKTYSSSLNMDEMLRLVLKLLEKLNIIAGYGRFYVKYVLSRVQYAKALAKRLNTKDRIDKSINEKVKSGVNEVNLLLKLFEEMDSVQQAMF